MKLVVSALCLVAIVAALPTDIHEEKRYICFGEKDCYWMTLEEAIEHRATHGKDCSDFIDYTSHRSLQQPPTTTRVRVFPVGPTQQNVVKPLLTQLSTDNLRSTVEKMASYKNRYYTSKTGVESMQWVLQQFQNLPGVEASLFTHSEYIQPSVIARIEGTSDEIVVIGAHGDSIAGRGGDVLAPGADDDASGVANLLEAARVIASQVKANGVKPKRTIEFIVYAAEEAGLRGSLDIAEQYQKQGVNVFAAYQIEMSGYNANLRNSSLNAPSAVSFASDYVDKSLLAFTRTLVDAYLSIPAKEFKCGYGCSDHAAWFQTGVAGVCAAEAGPFDPSLNPNMHTTGDKADILDYNHCLEFAKLATSFAIELSL